MTLTLIDRETRNPYRKHATRDKIIARLLLNVRRQAQQGEIFSTNEWQSFAGNYCRSLDDHLSIDDKALLIAILVKLDQPGKAYLPE